MRIMAGNDPAPGTIVYTGDLEHGFTSERLSGVWIGFEGHACEWSLERVRGVMLTSPSHCRRFVPSAGMTADTVA